MYKRCACGKFFDSITEKQIYCHPDCRAQKKYYKKKLKVRKICLQCNGIFFSQRNKQKFCSNKCRNKYHELEKRYEKKKCAFCGEVFETSKSYQLYCNNKCYVKAKNKRDLKNIYQIRKEV